MRHHEETSRSPSEQAAEATPTKRSGDYIVRPRARRFPTRFLPPILLTLGSLTFLAYRLATPDWPGLQVPKPRPSKPTVVASAAPPSPKAESLPSSQVPSKPAEKPEAGPKAADVWNDIQREAERKKAEMDELQREKDEAAKRAPRSTPPPPRRQAPPRWVQAELDRMMRDAQEQQRRHLEQFFGAQREFHQRMFDQMERGQPGGPAPGFPVPVPPPFMADQWEGFPQGEGFPQRQDRPGVFHGEIDRPGFHMRWEYRVEGFEAAPMFPPRAGL